MRYHTQWDDAEVSTADSIINHSGDSPPPGWTKRWGAALFSTTPEIFNTQEQIIKRRWLVFDLLSTTDAGRKVLVTWDKIDSDLQRADCELLSMFRFRTGCVNTHDLYLAARCSGESGSPTTETGYIAGFDTASSQIRISKVVNGAVTVLGSASASLPFTTAATTLIWVRFQLEGSALKIRYWNVGESEPSTWAVEVADSSITAAGAVGFYHSGYAATRFIGEWQFLSVGTDGDSAPRPITDDEYEEWLRSQTVERRVLVEMEAVGYSPATADRTKSVPFYCSNGPYVSHQQDTPSNRAYKDCIASVPTFRREIGLALRGRASLGFGDIVVDNGASGLVEPGVRDHWLRQKWRKSVVKIWLGDESWPRHDFRAFLVGRLGVPTGDSRERITFPVLEMFEELNNPVQENVFSGGTPVDNTYKPLLGGEAYGGIEPPLYDTANRRYQLHDGEILDLIEEYPSVDTVYDNGTSLSAGPFTVLSSTPGFDWFDSNTAPGWLIGTVVIFTAGTPPAPLALDTKYYVQFVWNSTRVSVAATKGGSAINITGSETGATFYVHNFDVDSANGVLELVTDAAGRIVAFGVCAADGGNALRTAAQAIAWMVFEKYGLSRNYQDDASFYNLHTALSSPSTPQGYWTGRSRHSVNDVIGKIADGSNCWFGQTADGLITVGQLDLPSALVDPVAELSEDDVAGLHEIGAILPVDFSKTDITVAPPFLTGGPYFIANTYLLEPTVLAKYAYPTATTPIDTPPQGDAQPKQQFDLLFSQASGADEQSRLATLFGKQIGVFRFKTHLGFLGLKLGDMISLTHSRMGWRAYTVGDPPSGDNPAAFDARRAVVIGMDVNLAEPGPLKVSLTVFRQKLQYAPELAEDIPAPSLRLDFSQGHAEPLVGSGTPSFARTSVAYVPDFEGLWRLCKDGEMRFSSLRRVENLAAGSSEDFGNASWTKTNVSIGGSPERNVATATAGNGELTQSVSTVAGSGARNYRSRFKITRLVGSGNIQLRMGASYTTVPVTDEPLIFSASGTVSAGSSFVWGIRIATSGDSILVEEAQLEETSGQIDVTAYPSEYVSIGVLASPYHGAFADGVKYFPYKNGNHTEGADVFIIEEEGEPIARSTLTGFFRENAATNRVTAPRDMTDAAWTKSNVTVALTSVGIDGRSSAATRLTATANNGFSVQVLSALGGSEICVYSAYVKRATGTGIVYMTIDGASFTDITALINSSSFTQVSVALSGTARTVGFLLATSGDAIDVDFSQEETYKGAFSSPINTAIDGTRDADSLSYSCAALDKARGVMHCDASASIGAAAPFDLVLMSTEASGQIAMKVPAGGYVLTGYLDADRGTLAISPTDFVRHKYAHRWAPGFSDVWANGAKGTSTYGTDTGSPSLSGNSATIYVGDGPAGNGISAVYGRAMIWREALNADQMADVTT